MSSAAVKEDLTIKCRFCHKTTNWFDQLGARGCVYHPGVLLASGGGGDEPRYTCCNLIPSWAEKREGRHWGLTIRDIQGCTACDHLAADEDSLQTIAVLPATKLWFSASHYPRATPKQETTLRPYLYLSPLFWSCLPVELQRQVDQEVENEEDIPSDVSRILSWLPKQRSAYDSNTEDSSDPTNGRIALPSSCHCREALAVGATLEPPTLLQKKRGQVLLRLQPPIPGGLVAIPRAAAGPSATTLERFQRAFIHLRQLQ